MLVDHANTQRDRILGRVNDSRLPINHDFTGIRLIEAVENVHQGGFSGTILTKQGMNLSLTQVKIDMVVG